MSTEERIRFFHHRWSAPVLYVLKRESGARFVLLVNRLGVSRSVLRATLDSLVELGYVARNPGYGHPLRPEYVLTSRGETIARRCTKILDRINERERLLRKWTLPTLAVMGRNSRFSHLLTALPGVTPRALALALKDLERLRLVHRSVVDEYPPTTVYGPTGLGRELRRYL